MPRKPSIDLAFSRLPHIPPEEILAHMSEPRIAEHLPLLTSKWDMTAVADFVAAKEERWRRDGLGHWAILCDGRYAGWGGFQKEDEEWDYGLVLRAENFGIGMQVTKMAIAFALADERIPHITILLPPSRKRLGGIARLGAVLVGPTDYGGVQFLKYRLKTN